MSDGDLRETPRQKKEGALCRALNAYSSNIYSLLVRKSLSTRFLKCLQRTEHDWLLILGIFDSEGTPLVAFGTGSDFLEALHNLGRSIAGNRWRVDKYTGSFDANQP